VLFTNRKSHTGFLLVLKSITLNDCERRNDRRRALCLRQLSFLFLDFLISGRSGWSMSRHGLPCVRVSRIVYYESAVAGISQKQETNFLGNTPSAFRHRISLKLQVF